MTTTDTAEATAAAPAAAPAAPAPQASPAPSPTASAPAPAPSAPAVAPAASLLARGAAPSPAPAADAPASQIPPKFHVKRDDGTIDDSATLAKLGEGYRQLEQRLGSGEAPPSTPEDYKPTLPEGLTIDALKADPLYVGFLKGAHAKGMTNAQLGYVLEAFQQREALRNDAAGGEAALRAVWPTDQDMAKGLASASRAVAAFASVDQALAQRVEAKFGNDPDFLRLMNEIGKELQEDSSVVGGLNQSEEVSRESLMASKAYLDPKHPEHQITVARVQALYARKFPEQR